MFFMVLALVNLLGCGNDSVIMYQQHQNSVEDAFFGVFGGHFLQTRNTDFRL
jgi:hypothetical protein